MIKNTLFLLILLIPFVNAVTLDDTLITSNGLNSSINSSFEISFDQLDVLDNAITFYNLTYTHPNNCGGLSSSQPIFNYTNKNEISFSSDVFPSIQCGGGGSSGKINVGRDRICSEIEDYLGLNNLTINDLKEEDVNEIYNNLIKEFFVDRTLLERLTGDQDLCFPSEKPNLIILYVVLFIGTVYVVKRLI